MTEKKEKQTKSKRPVGRPPKMVLHIDAKPEDIAWALTNTSPKALEEWKERKAQDSDRK